MTGVRYSVTQKNSNKFGVSLNFYYLCGQIKTNSMKMKNLTIRFVLLILCALNTNTTFAQDVRQKPVIKKQTTTTTKKPATSTNKQTSTKQNQVTTHKWKFVGDYYDGLAMVQGTNGKWGFIDKTGRLVIPCKWNYIDSFCDGLAMVQGDNWKWGFIDKTGRLVIPCKWKEANAFSEGLAPVRDDNGNKYYIDKTGRVVK